MLANPTPALSDQFGWSVAISGTRVVVGALFDDGAGVDNGSAYIYGALPEISVELQPSNASVADGATIDYGNAVPLSTTTFTFTIKNTGPGDLFLNGSPNVAVSGADAAMFTVTAPPASPVPGPTGSTTFTVRFIPTGTGVRSAALSIQNNDTDEAPFDINITGNVLSFTTDTDGDGLSDASEQQMAALGFDPMVAQPGLVNTYFNGANGAGLYTASQVQVLNVNTPLIQRDPNTGAFTLTIGLKKATNLTLPFSDIPFTVPGTSVNGAGKVEFQFSVPDNAAFFRLQAQ